MPSPDLIVDIVHSQSEENWKVRNEEAFEALFGDRYPKAASKQFTLRAPEMSSETGVPFAAYIHRSNPKSGAYSGLSFVLFPVEGAPCLVGLGVGTQGLNPDEAILGRPGHARKCKAISTWLNSQYGNGQLLAWAKDDPTRMDSKLPDSLSTKWSAYSSVFERYGHVMYALFTPTLDQGATKNAVSAFLDLFFEERGFGPLRTHEADAARIKSAWNSCLLPKVSQTQVKMLLDDRRFVILQGPPGTGKTTLAQQLLETEYRGFGASIQFHPNTTYESFIGGLAPDSSVSDVGLRFLPKPGHLMEAAQIARQHPDKPYLLHIDEINRADLGKVLGEAIYLLEPRPLAARSIRLSHHFPELGNELSLPSNLHIIGTMNSSDRSIAIVDVAVRRRFAFLSLWPQHDIVRINSCPLMLSAFEEILDIFIEHAGEDSFNLVPGHSYFLEANEDAAKRRLKTELQPLLEEYLTQGYVGGFAEPLRTYVQFIRALQ